MTLAELATCEGEWTGTNELYLPGAPPDASPSGVAMTTVLDGRFVRLDYTWAAKDKPQQGSLLVGRDSACWVDTWHMGRKMLWMKSGSDLSYTGTYPAPDGPDWGWRIEITRTQDGHLRLGMTNIEPDGTEEPAVSAVYSRVASRTEL